MQSFNLTEPAFAFGFGDASDQVVADLGQSVALCGAGPEHRTANVPLAELTWMPPELLSEVNGQ